MAHELDCPKCPFSPMEARKAMGLTLEECPKCGGRWYDAGELDRAVIDPAALKRDGGVKLDRVKPGRAMCPRCHGAMENGAFLDPLLRVDRCGKCQGVWLDKAEVPLVDRLIAERG